MRVKKIKVIEKFNTAYGLTFAVDTDEPLEIGDIISTDGEDYMIDSFVVTSKEFPGDPISVAVHHLGPEITLESISAKLGFNPLRHTYYTGTDEDDSAESPFKDLTIDEVRFIYEEALKDSECWTRVDERTKDDNESE